MSASLRGRLVVGTTLGATAVLALACGALYALVRQRLVRQLDLALGDEARLLATTVDSEDEGVGVDLEDLAAHDAVRPQGEYVVLRRDDGALLFRSPGLGGDDLAPAGTARAGDEALPRWTALPGGRAGRVVRLEFTPRRDRPGAGALRLTLLLGRDTADLEATLAILRGALLGVAAASAAGQAFVLRAVVRRALRPLGELAEDIAHLGAEDLGRRVGRGVALPDELAPVVGRVNDLLARLEAAFARERALSSDVAHELRTPLAGLRTSLEVALTRPRPAEEHAATLRDALGIVVDLQGLVEKLLWLARLEAGEGRGSVEEVRVADLVEDTWAPFAGRAEARGVRVEWALDHDVRLATDPRLLELVVRNVVENAASYVDAGGRVALGVAQVADGVEVRATNSGSRLAQADVPLAFQRFWRGSSARTEAALRCGLGLSLVERAVRAQGGTVAVRTSDGGDFELRVVLPHGAAPAPAAPALGLPLAALA